MKTRLHTSLLLAPLFLCLLTVTSTRAQAPAQPDDLGWAVPANLSRGGAAASPMVVVVPDGKMRIMWWDELEGLMVADGTGAALRTPGTASGESTAGAGWSAPTQAPILVPTGRTNQTGENILVPLQTVPQLVAGAEGEAHAFWLGQADQDTGVQALLHSHLAPDSTSWSGPQRLADSAGIFDASADISGVVHVAYVQPEQVGNSASGMYYRQSRGGAAWSAPAAIQRSRYLRLMPAEGDTLHLTADDAENVYAAWEDPQSGQVLVAESHNGGGTWQRPRPVVLSDGAPLQSRTIGLPGRQEGIVWEFDSEGQGRIAARSLGDAVMLTVWDGARWSAAKRLALQFQDSVLGKPLQLSDVRLALAAPGGGAKALVVVGVDQTQDVWITGIQTEALEQVMGLQTEALEQVMGLSQEPSTLQPADGQDETRPANLSRSGAASSPALVAVPDGRLRAFWWDQFDGLLVADGEVLTTKVVSGTQEIVSTHDSWSKPRPVPLPATSTPWIQADAAGGVHAFWLQRPATERPASAEQPLRGWPLMYSQLASDATTWLPAITLADSAASYDVAADASGALHLAYITAVDSPSTSAGVYYRRTAEEDGRWTAPVAVEQSRYLRLLSPENAHVRLAAGEAETPYVAWDDPRTGDLRLAYSPDGGQTWEASDLLGDSDAQPRRGQLLAVPGGQVLLLWEDARSSEACSLYQAPATALLSGGIAAGQRVLEGLVTCPERPEFLPLGEDKVLMIAGGGTDSLTLAAWDGQQWSELRRVSYGFEDTEMRRQVYLGSLRAALVSLLPASPDGGSDQALVAVGTDQEGDVWASSSQMGMLDIVFAPPSPWSSPMRVADVEGASQLPAMASDAEGRLHILWSQQGEGATTGSSLLYARRDEVATASGTEVRWTSPAQILPSSDGEADQPFLLAVDGQLHAVWRGGQEKEIFHSQAFATDAYVASGWQEPQSLAPPGLMASWPHMTTDPGGTLHVAYAVPLNEGRGIYYTSSADGGQTWSPARQIFDAAGAGWARADYPRLAVDLAGTIHVVWTRADPFGSGPADAIAYSQSVDGGETWSAPLDVAEGAYAWPQVITNGTGQVHLLWNDTSEENVWWYQWSPDGGLTWTRPERVPGFGETPGPAGVMSDGTGTVSLVGLGQDSRGEPALLYTTWDGARWSEREVFGLDLAKGASSPGVSTALLPALGQLDVVFRAESSGAGEEGTQAALWHTRRTLPVVVVTPVPASIPRPTATMAPTPVPTTLATPTPAFGTEPPVGSRGTMQEMLPVLVPGGLAVLLVIGAFGARAVLSRRRR